jgi:uncharacterized membrane protein YqhA
MYPLKSVFEKALWNSRFVVLFAVITSVLAGVVLFCAIGVESLRVLAGVELVQKLIKGQFQVPEKFGIAPVEIWHNILAA